MNALAPLLVALVATVSLVGIVRFEVFCLRDLARASRVNHLTKTGWAVVVLVCIPIGGLLYLYTGRPR